MSPSQFFDVWKFQIRKMTFGLTDLEIKKRSIFRMLPSGLIYYIIADLNKVHLYCHLDDLIGNPMFW